MVVSEVKGFRSPWLWVSAPWTPTPSALLYFPADRGFAPPLPLDSGVSSQEGSSLVEGMGL